MPMTSEFLKGVNETITDEQVAAILKEHSTETTGLKANRDDIKKERDGFKTDVEKITAEYAAKEAEFLKQIEERDKQIKASGNEELKAYYEAEKKSYMDANAAKFTDLEKGNAAWKEKYGILNSEYLKVLKNTELDRAMDTLGNLIPERKNILRDVFWARNNFDLKDVEGEGKKLLNPEYKNIADTLQAFVATEEGKSFLLANNSGGGATGSTSVKTTGKNPYAKETLNVTEQILLQKENPALANQLKAQAGVQ